MPILLRAAARQDTQYREHWDTHARATRPDEIVWAVLGDSAAVGIGADSVEEAYVSQVAARLEQATSRPVRVVNLAVSGATAATVLADQVPLLRDLLAEQHVDAVTCVVGGNDVTWPVRFRVEAFAEPLEEIARALPAGSTLGLVPTFRIRPFEPRVRIANAAVRRIAARHGLGVADVHTATRRTSLRHQLSRLSKDRFHPNAAGYGDWADAVLPEVLRQVQGRAPLTQSALRDDGGSPSADPGSASAAPASAAPAPGSVHAASFADLDPTTAYRLWQLRMRVFVVEQEAAYLDLDGRDLEPATVHLWTEDEAGAPVATLRVLDDGDVARIGRVVTAPEARGQALAGRLMDAALERVGARDCVLDAQAHLAHWYARWGFVQDGEGFSEDGIPHVPMRRAAGQG